MQVVDFSALNDIDDLVCIGDNPKKKTIYFKVVLFKKSSKIYEKNEKLLLFFRKFLKKFSFFSAIRENTFLEKYNHRLADDDYLNVAEFIVKFKPPVSWFSRKVYDSFINDIAALKLPNNWQLSGRFIEENFLEVSTMKSKDIEVSKLFEKEKIENELVEPVEQDDSFSPERKKWLDDFKNDVFGGVSSWENLSIDRSIVSQNISAIKSFNGLYGIDSQIKMVLTPIVACVESKGKRKAHTVLFGPAGCGKTTILDRLDGLLGTSNVLRLDAPCMTKSGLETLLLEMPNIPPVIIIEEIEKCSENNLRTLLGIMDERSEICKTTVSGSVTRKIDSLIFCTVNDVEKFNKYLDGALSSRFKNKIFLPRPTEKTIKLILNRDIKENGGDVKWIDPAIEFSKELNITDPRIILSFLINGDRLLDNSFQKDYRDMDKLRKESESGNS